MTVQGKRRQQEQGIGRRQLLVRGLAGFLTLVGAANGFPRRALGAIGLPILHRPKDLNNLTEFERLHVPKVRIAEVIEDGANAPVIVEMEHPMQPDHYITSIRILDYQDPIIWKGTFYFTPESGAPYLYTQVRLDAGKSTVYAVADSTPAEYIAESHACPNCYVVAGFGVKGTNDKESPMPSIHKPPIALSFDELIAVDTWLFAREGEEPPSPEEIENAYKKFIPEADRPKPAGAPGAAPAGPAPGAPVVTGDEPVNEIFTKALCFACHTIPGIPGAVGAVGPKLVEKTNAPQRLKDPAYKGKATSVREYIMESIITPSMYVVKPFPDNIMPKDFGKKLNAAAINKIIDYLSQLEEGKEPPKIK